MEGDDRNAVLKRCPGLIAIKDGACDDDLGLGLAATPSDPGIRLTQQGSSTGRVERAACPGDPRSQASAQSFFPAQAQGRWTVWRTGTADPDTRCEPVISRLVPAISPFRQLPAPHPRCRMLHDVGAHIAAANKCCIPSGVESPASSVIVQRFLRRMPDSNSSTNARAAAATPPG